MGEVLDEFDRRPDAIVFRPVGAPLVRGDVLVEDVNEALGTQLPEDQADTIGGLVQEELGRIPEPGDVLTLPSGRITVISVHERSVTRVSVLAAPTGSATSEES